MNEDRLGEEANERATRLNAPGPDAPTNASSDPQSLPHDPSVPRQIGPYRIVRLLGAGGMGMVLEGEQTVPIYRRVAIKLIRAGHTDATFMARFDAERQALALMDHPNIAHVFDAGTTSDGQPYFVMEFIEGETITSYCDNRKFSVPERLGLLITICEAVQHAHQKGIIHRDLKPANILVSENEGAPFPRIIDFGIAKATTPLPGAAHGATVLGEFVGTPAYMSPEQADPWAKDVDTRADLYSLGVILYELLIGTLPFDSHQLRERGFDAMRHTLRNVTPPKLSDRLKTMSERDQQQIALSRASHQQALQRTISGDLDAIVAKLLEKDRDQRYDSASGLALDLNHFLNNQPVLATSPSPAYRAKKFVRRHRVGVIGVSASVLLLIGAAVSTTVAMFEARRAEAKALSETQTSRHVSNFLVDMFTIPGAAPGSGRSVTAETLLDTAAQKVRADIDASPAAQARLLQALGMTYRNLGIYDDAEPLLKEALEIRRQSSGIDESEVAESLNTVGSLYLLRGQYQEATPLLRAALEIQGRTLDPTDPEIARSFNNLATALMGSKDFEGAEVAYRRALTIRETRLGPSHPDCARILLNLGQLFRKTGHQKEALVVFQRALAIREKAFGTSHRDVGATLINLAFTYLDMDQPQAAVPVFERAIRILEETLGPQHPSANEARRGLALAQECLARGGACNVKPVSN